MDITALSLAQYPRNHADLSSWVYMHNVHTYMYMYLLNNIHNVHVHVYVYRIYVS